MSFFRQVADFLDDVTSKGGSSAPAAEGRPNYDPVDYRRVRSDVLKEIVGKGSVLVRVYDKQYRVTAKEVEVPAR